MKGSHDFGRFLVVVKKIYLSDMISPMVSSCSLISDIFIKKSEIELPFFILVL
jgi:hypothetical protein